MFGCDRATVVFASSTKRRTKSSSHASSSRICFTTSFFSKPPAPRRVASTTRAMPPRASSRSSTYLPKTWGYIQAGVRRRSQAHLSTQALLPVLALAALAAVGACHKDTIVTTRTVTAFVPASCGVTAQAFATYEPLGDFEPPAIMPGPQFSAVGSPLPQLDTNARELVVSASQSAGRWLGLAPIAASGDVDVMILPEALSCALATVVGGS